MPTSTPNGIVSGSTGGMAQSTSAITVEKDALLAPTRTANSLSAARRKITKVASSVPNTALVRISRKM